ncbi:hypothetical protein HPB49_022913 [Dermacentor silvarum]|uniref:Uncharacterized protein n=1 Tax=Dermacentor silvarum TaxID=543639 RepID=A0ACB8DRN1_DERSI|nr:hypothetical protein HPB49_022913 [Dermacentor silvarum]
MSTVVYMEHTKSPEEKLAWMQTLAKAAHDLKQRKSSLKVYHQGQKSPEGAELGQRAPVLVRADTVSRCMRCSAGFSTFGLRWKHHCHACGIFIERLSRRLRAANACRARPALHYDGGRAGRVCDACYAAMTPLGDDDQQQHCPLRGCDELPSPAGPVPPFPLPPGQQQCSGAVLSGYLRLKTGGRRAHWQRRWFALHRDFVLYSFRSEQDELPLTSVPVPGLAVAAAEKADGLEPRTSAAAFKLFHQRRAYVFQAQDAEDAQSMIMLCGNGIFCATEDTIQERSCLCTEFDLMTADEDDDPVGSLPQRKHLVPERESPSALGMIYPVAPLWTIEDRPVLDSPVDPPVARWLFEFIPPVSSVHFGWMQRSLGAFALLRSLVFCRVSDYRTCQRCWSSHQEIVL